MKAVIYWTIIIVILSSIIINMHGFMSIPCCFTDSFQELGLIKVLIVHVHLHHLYSTLQN